MEATALEVKMREASRVDPLAPSGDVVTGYDLKHLALYAAILDADDAGVRWLDAAASLLKVDFAPPLTEACWRSHLQRARWITQEGLPTAVTAFGMPASAT
jgi:hypothetical protein